MSTSLRNKLIAAVSIPSSLAATLLYLASVADTGGDGKWLFRMGCTFAVLAFVCGRITWISHHQRMLETQIAEIARYTRRLERQLENVRSAVDSQLVIDEWTRAYGRVQRRNGVRHLDAVRAAEEA